MPLWQEGAWERWRFNDRQILLPKGDNTSLSQTDRLNLKQDTVAALINSDQTVAHDFVKLIKFTGIIREYKIS